jgi:hypothetical protein
MQTICKVHLLQHSIKYCHVYKIQTKKMIRYAPDFEPHFLGEVNFSHPKISQRDNVQQVGHFILFINKKNIKKEKHLGSSLFQSLPPSHPFSWPPPFISLFHSLLFHESLPPPLSFSSFIFPLPSLMAGHRMP